MIKQDDEGRTAASTASIALLEPGMGSAPSLPAARRAEITLHQLRIFWAVAHSDTLTKAAKQLGLAQPSLSQQLSKLETTVGTQLFHRRSNEMSLTEAGSYLLPKAEQVLRNLNDLEDGLRQFSGGQRVTVRLAGINSVLRVVLPSAINRTRGGISRGRFRYSGKRPRRRARNALWPAHQYRPAGRQFRGPGGYRLRAGAGH